MPVITEAKSAEIFQPVALENLPDGLYFGRWSEYQVIVIINGTQYRLKTTTEGILSLSARCIVEINNGSVTITTDYEQ